MWSVYVFREQSHGSLIIFSWKYAALWHHKKKDAPMVHCEKAIAAVLSFCLSISFIGALKKSLGPLQSFALMEGFLQVLFAAEKEPLVQK